MKNQPKFRSSTAQAILNFNCVQMQILLPFVFDIQELDFEVELAFVMAKPGRNIKVRMHFICVHKLLHILRDCIQATDAMSYVAGYTVAHDVSARDWQMRRNGGQWLLGKTFDTYCPLGPVIVTTAGLSGNDDVLLE